MSKAEKTGNMGRLFNEKKRFFPVGMFRSMRIAFKNLFRPAMTIRYPHERAHIPERARWAVEINFAKDGTHRCTACRVCEKECPDYLIDLDIETAEDRSRHIKHWHYRRGGCMMCGLCVEACPFNAIKMGQDYELAHANPDLLEYDLLTNVAAYKRPRPAAKPAAKPVASAAKPARPEHAEQAEAPGKATQEKRPLATSNKAEQTGEQLITQERPARPERPALSEMFAANPAKSGRSAKTPIPRFEDMQLPQANKPSSEPTEKPIGEEQNDA